MRIAEIKDSIVKLAQIREPIILEAGPGVGKTDTVIAAAKAIGHEVILSHPSVSAPTAYKGQPFAFQDQTGQAKARHLPYEDLESLITADKPTIAFFDDMGQATPATQAAIMQLFLQRQVAGHKISDHVWFMGATNRAEDKAGVGSLLEPLKGRSTILHLEPHIDDWCGWAYEQDWMPVSVPAFLRFKTELLNAFKPSRDMKNTPTPRNWSRLAKKVSIDVTGMELLAGDVGDAAASEFLAFYRLMEKMPDPDECIKNPKTAPVPAADEVSVLYGLMGALAHRCDGKTIAGIKEYLDRVGAEFSVMCIKDAIVKHGDKAPFTKTKAFQEWALKHQDVLGMYT